MTTIHAARWVLPVTTQPIQDGAVAVDERGIITYVGPRASAPKGEIHDLGESILLPGFINTHTHLELTMLRGQLDDLSFPEWIDQIRTLRTSGKMHNAVLLESARAGIAEGLCAGITTYADTSFAGDIVMQAMLEAGVRGVVYQEVFGPAPDQCAAALADLKNKIFHICHLVDESLHDKCIVRIGLSPHAPYTVSDDLYRAVVEWSIEAGLPLALHIAESAEEQQLVTQGTGPFADRLNSRGISTPSRAESPAKLLHKLGALGRNSLLIHCVYTDDDDISLIKRHGSSIAHCPISNKRLGHDTAPLGKWLKAGIPVGLGSDSMASNDCMDLRSEARQAATAHPITPQIALELATIRGAEALGIDARVGSLEIGKEADLASFPLSQPVTDPVEAAIFSATRTTPTLADFVAIKGDKVYP